MKAARRKNVGPFHKDIGFIAAVNAFYANVNRVFFLRRIEMSVTKKKFFFVAGLTSLLP